MSTPVCLSDSILAFHQNGLSGMSFKGQVRLGIIDYFHWAFPFVFRRPKKSTMMQISIDWLDLISKESCRLPSFILKFPGISLSRNGPKTTLWTIPTFTYWLATRIRLNRACDPCDPCDPFDPIADVYFVEDKLLFLL